MKIAYGVHGFGRGHAMRAFAILPTLTERHEVFLMAGDDAYEALWADYAGAQVMRLPVFKYHYGRHGKLSNYLNLKRNLPGALDLFWEGPALQMVVAALEDFKPDVVISDSEAFTHRAARKLGIPRISFDHFGLLAYCAPPIPGRYRWVQKGNAVAYKLLFGSPDRAIVSSFFDAPAKRPGVCVVGPVIRKEVRRTKPTRGEHLLVYFSKDHEFTPRIERALMELDCPVRIYGTIRRGLQGNLQFKPKANLPFIEDLASCRAVYSTAGNQLCGEVVYYGKPMLAAPIECLEQRLNALQIERMGLGICVSRRQVTAQVLRDFLAREEQFRRHAPGPSRDGEHEALEAIEKYLDELADPRRRAGAAVPSV